MIKLNKNESEKPGIYLVSDRKPKFCHSRNSLMSFLRRQESSKLLCSLDSCLRRNDTNGLEFENKGFSVKHYLSPIIWVIVAAFTLLSFYGCSGTKPKIGFSDKLAELADSLQKNDAMEYYLNGTIHEEAGEMYPAIIQYQLAHLYDPESVEIILSLAKAYLKIGEHKAAGMLIGNGRKLNPDNEELLVALLQSYVFTGQLFQGVTLFDELKLLRPLSDRELKQYALILTKMNRFDEVLEIYQTIIKKGGEQPSILEKIAHIYLMQRDVEQAKAAFYRLLELDSENHNALFILGSIELNNRNFNDAETLFRSAVNIEPGEIKYWANLMRALDLQREQEELLEVTSEATVNFPESAFFLEMHGNVLLSFERYDEASEALRKAIALDSTRISPYQALGYLYHQQKNWEKSAEIYNAALTQNPDNPMVLNNYAYMLSTQNYRLEEALEMVEKALVIEPENPTFLDTRGWIYYQMGQHEKALTDILQAAEEEGENAEINEHLGHIYNALGNYEKAGEYWRKASELEPDNKEYKRLAP